MGARRPCNRGHHTAAALAKRVGTCPRTIRNHVAEPRRDYEARSIARLKPWLAQGISRATWYRRRKLAQQRAT
jgi:hypothetical protein